MNTFRTTTLILLIPLLALTTIADVVDQDSFVLPNQQIITSLDDPSAPYERHHPSPAIHSRLASADAASPVSCVGTDCRQSTTRLSPSLLFFLRAPPLS